MVLPNLLFLLTYIDTDKNGDFKEITHRNFEPMMTIKQVLKNLSRENFAEDFGYSKCSEGETRDFEDFQKHFLDSDSQGFLENYRVLDARDFSRGENGEENFAFDLELGNETVTFTARNWPKTKIFKIFDAMFYQCHPKDLEDPESHRKLNKDWKNAQEYVSKLVSLKDPKIMISDNFEIKYCNGIMQNREQYQVNRIIPIILDVIRYNRYNPDYLKYHKNEKYVTLFEDYIQFVVEEEGIGNIPRKTLQFEYMVLDGKLQKAREYPCNLKDTMNNLLKSESKS